MTPDLRDYARLLLRREPTRSLPIGVLRERLREATGKRLAGTLALEQALGADPAFRLLSPAPLIQCGLRGYAPEQLGVGFPQPEPRILLVEPEPEAEEPAGPFAGIGDSLVALLACEELRSDVAEAVAALEEIGRQVDLAIASEGAAARSTIPPPGPPLPEPVRRRTRPPASRRPRSPVSR